MHGRNHWLNSARDWLKLARTLFGYGETVAAIGCLVHADAARAIARTYG